MASHGLKACIPGLDQKFNRGHWLRFTASSMRFDELQGASQIASHNAASRGNLAAENPLTREITRAPATSFVKRETQRTRESAKLVNSDSYSGKLWFVDGPDGCTLRRCTILKAFERAWTKIRSSDSIPLGQRFNVRPILRQFGRFSLSSCW
ncbi:predicted protein [Histoplasma capsulatum var. duboisii H88]|uniref:Predicted protein n=1 Tax=Ajellomyces capsulatus (strain H88) TaxID=544711 RepID=F0UEM3_AJEC8|nr:predicted protein [Histoplasma capsulatum var. duboisii H88]